MMKEPTGLRHALVGPAAARGANGPLQALHGLAACAHIPLRAHCPGSGLSQAHIILLLVPLHFTVL